MGSLSKLAVDRPITFLMMTLILLGFGFYGLQNLRLNLYPDVSFPTRRSSDLGYKFNLKFCRP